MLLAIDVGNTNTVFALFRNRQVLRRWRISTVRERTSDEYAAALIQLIEVSGFGYRAITSAVISSVVPQAVLPLRWMCRDFFDCQPHVVGEDLVVPIEVCLENPREAGADRLVNAFAAAKRYRMPLVVIDFGTATTFDVVDREGRFAGGVIAPGINLSLEALHRAAAKLPRIAIDKPERVIGNSTVSAMQSGVFFGYVGLLEGLLERIAGEFDAPMTRIATGGLAPLFAKATPAIEHVDADLTLAGLGDLYYEHGPAAGVSP